MRRPSRAREVDNADRKHIGCRRRCRDPHRPQSGAVARRLRSALDRQCRDAVALDQPGRRRSGHHRRGDAGRECLRSDPAHSQGASRSADHRDERAEHFHDRDPRVRTRRLRISAEAVRSEGAHRHCRARAVRAEREAAGERQDRRFRFHSAGRPLAGDAGNLPRAGAADADRFDRDDLGRIRHRQGAGGQSAARLRQAAGRHFCRHQHGGDSARSHRIGIVRPREGRLHRRQHAQLRPLRAGRGRHAVPGRNRRHADGSADPAIARAAAGRIHHGRRTHADQERRSHHRRHQQGFAAADPAGLVPRRSVLPP